MFFRKLIAMVDSGNAYSPASKRCLVVAPVVQSVTTCRQQSDCDKIAAFNALLKAFPCSKAR
jgi:hypothetical protein